MLMRRIDLVFLVWLALGIPLMIHFSSWERQTQTEAARTALEATLENPRFSLSDAAEELAAEVERVWREVPAPSGKMRDRLRRLLQEYPMDSVLIVFFQDEGKRRWQFPQMVAPVEAFARMVELSRLKPYGLRKPRTLMPHEKELPGWFALWHACPPRREAGNEPSLLILMRRDLIRPGFLLGRFLQKLRKAGGAVGLVDRVDPAEGIPLPGYSREETNRFADGAEWRPTRFLETGRGFVSALPVDHRYVLLGETRFPSPVLPPVPAGFLLLTGIAFWRARLGSKPKKIRLAAGLGIALFLAAGVPLICTGVVWEMFATNRMNALIRQELAGMNAELIFLDNQFPVKLRKNQALFSALVGTLEKGGQSFPAFLKTLDELEMTCYFDNGFVISTQGVVLRDYSHVGSDFRPIIMLPKDQRREILQENLEIGRVPHERELPLLLSLDARPECVQSFWHFKVFEEDLAKLMSGLGRSFLHLYDQERGRKGPGDTGTDDPASILYGGLLETQGGNLGRLLHSNLGRYSDFGNSREAAKFISLIVHDQAGAGAYVLFLVQHILGMQLSYLRELSVDPHFLEGAGVFAESLETPFRFPKTSPRLLRAWMDRLSPLRRSCGDVVEHQGQKFLVSAYLCRHLQHFVLFSLKPYSVVVEKQKPLAREFGKIGLLMAGFILLMAYRLRTIVLWPAQRLLTGIEAMEKRDSTFRIRLGTGDEWDSLADAFNKTLAGMEELAVARIVQTRLLPQGVIETPTGQFQGISIMCQEVGGDYFDGIAGEDGSLICIIGDVTGHGVSAALVVAMAKSAFTSLVRSGVTIPGEILTIMSRLFFAHLGKTKMMTCQVVRLYPDGRLEYANAGHPGPYLISGGNTPESLTLPGFPLGMKNRRGYPTQTRALCPGNKLLLFSDGITEAINSADDLFTEVRLKTVLSGMGDLPANVLIPGIQEHVRAFSRERPWEDDVTIAILSFRGPGMPSPVS
jgi:hypothetical protein